MQAKRKLEGKDSVIHVRGYPVEQQKIGRYVKRKGMSENAILSQPSPVAGEHFASHLD
jgi:hypothetical protein